MNVILFLKMLQLGLTKMNRLNKYIILLVVLLSSTLIQGCSSEKNKKEVKIKTKKNTIPDINFSIVNTYPHDKNSFTEGLFMHNGLFFESTGSPSHLPKTKSAFGILSLETGEIDIKKELDKRQYFGEGITVLHDKVYQLTYKRQVCFVYDLKSFKELRTFNYETEEGWGMTNDGIHLIMSDGSYNLYFRDPVTFNIVKKIPVTENKTAVFNLNELEYVNGFIYANIWMTNTIVKIDAQTGYVVGKIDVSSLRDLALIKNPQALETNGIAYNIESNTLYVTGKMWPKMFEIKLAE